MSEQTGATTTTEETNNEQGKPAEKAFEAITSQEAFDKAIQARIARERARFADYDELKASADKLKQFEDAQKTEAQKAADRIAELEKENASLKVESLRSQVARAKSDPEKGLVLDPALLSGSTQEELEASADALIKFRGDAPAPSPFPKADLSQGAKGSAGGGTTADRFASFLGEKLT